MSRNQLPAQRAGRNRARPGFTLVELLITMTMLSIVGAAVISVFNNQQRFVRSASEVGAIRTQLQTAMAVLPQELREVSPAGGDIAEMSDSAMVVHAPIVSSIACEITATTVTLAPEQLDPARPRRLTSVSFPPQPGDSLYIWDDGASTAANNDTWRSASGAAYAIAAVNPVAGACLAPYTSVGNSTAPAYVITVDGATPLRATLLRGSGLRITRTMRYGLYQSSSDGQWYLGYREPSMASYQYVAGPFRGYGTPSGLRFRFWDVSGAEINVNGVKITAPAVTRTVARMEITVRAASATPLSLGGTTGGRQFYDSLRVGMTFRNRN